MFKYKYSNQQSQRYKKCSICGVRRLPKSNILLSNFPLDPDRCRLWVKACGIEDFVHLPIEKLHELKFICGSHFTHECFNEKGNRLLHSAVPTLGLSRPSLPDELFTEFPLHTKAYYKKQNIKRDDPKNKSWETKVRSSSKVHSESNSEVVKPSDTIGDDSQAGVPKTKSPKTKTESSSIIHSESNSEKVETSYIIEDDNQAHVSDVDASNDKESVENIAIKKHHELTGPFSWQKKPEIQCFPDNDGIVCLDSEDQQKDTLIDLDLKDDASEYTNYTHGIYKCNECHEEILGGRFTCAQCVDYDLCASCASERGTHTDHYLLRVPPSRPPDEVQLVLQKIRELLEIGNVHITTLTTDASGDDSEVKIEVKEEKEEGEDPLNVEDMLATVPDIDDDLPLISQGSCDANNVRNNTTEPVRTLQTLSRESLKRPRDTVRPFSPEKKTRRDTARHRVIVHAERVPQMPAGVSALSDTVLETASTERVSQPLAGGSALSDQTDRHQINTSKHLFLQTLRKDQRVLINLKKVKILKLYAPKKS